MGLVLDSSVLVAAERQGKNARRMIADIAGAVGNEEIALSVVTLAELAHGAARANTAERRNTRLAFIDELLRLPVHPVSASIALRAGQMDGEYESRGVRVPLADLLIAVTAIELNFGVATSNLRHFQRIQDLRVVEL